MTRRYNMARAARRYERQHRPNLPITTAVDCLAVFRLSRLLIDDTVPPAKALRAAVFARWPKSGWPLDPIDWRETATPGVYAHVRTGTEVRAVEAPAVDGPSLTAAEDTTIGELLSCYWCTSWHCAVVVVAARALAPRAWDPIARVLAGSAVAGMIAGRPPRMTGYEHAIGDDARILVARDIDDGEGFLAGLSEATGLFVVGLFGDQTLDGLSDDDLRQCRLVSVDAVAPLVAALVGHYSDAAAAHHRGDTDALSSALGAIAEPLADLTREIGTTP